MRRFDRSTLEIPDVLLVGALGLVAVSLVLPWFEASEPVFVANGSLASSVTGYEAIDGIVLAIATAGAVAVGWFRSWDAATGGLVGGVGVFVAGLGAVYIADPLIGADGGEAVDGLVEAGIGLYVVFLAGVLLVVAAVVGYRGHSATESDADSEADLTVEKDAESEGGQESDPASGSEGDPASGWESGQETDPESEPSTGTESQ